MKKEKIKIGSFSQIWGYLKCMYNNYETNLVGCMIPYCSPNKCADENHKQGQHL